MTRSFCFWKHFFLANAVFFGGFVVIFLETIYIGFFWIFFKWLLLQRLASVVSVYVSGS